MKKEKKALILSIVAIAILSLFIIGVTYAHFEAMVDPTANANINVTTTTTDLLTFSVGEEINIIADQSSFAEDKTSLSGTTTAKASLTANNATNDATMNYYVYVNITNNTFKYTTENKDAELILSVTGPDGEVTSLDGYTYKEVTDIKGNTIKGFDVTTTGGFISITKNESITAGTKSTVAKATNEEEWTFTLTFVNYDADQTANAGASLNAEIKILKEKITLSAADICKNGQTLSSCIITLNNYGNTLYYHGSTLTNGAGDNSYRYAGASSSVNNYVCFGSDDATCPTDNLYRIIGVIDGKVKLIKSTSLGDMAWDSDNSNTWSTSSLNTYLNGTYLDAFGENWQSKIAITTWKVGGILENIVTAATMYTNEMNSTTSGTDGLTEYSSKIALMYAHDYGFAASPSAWTTAVANYNGSDSSGTSITTINWLHLGSYEWLVTRTPSSPYHSYQVYSGGGVHHDFDVTSSYAVRPVFYLTSLATYSSGVGTSDNPIRLG